MEKWKIMVSFAPEKLAKVADDGSEKRELIRQFLESLVEWTKRLSRP